MTNQSPAETSTIVTLIASATEIVCALGLRKRLVGISHECDYPPDVEGLPRLSAPKVGIEMTSAEIDRGVREIVRDGLSVYRVDVDELRRLQPDVIVTQDHCEVCAVSLGDVEEALCTLRLPATRVYSLHPARLSDVYGDILRVADGLGVPERGRRVVRDMQRRLAVLRARMQETSPRRVALIEWLAPPMIAGGWMPELARMAGAEPVIMRTAHRFAEVSWPDIAAADPEIVVVLPCGFSVARSLEDLADPEVARGIRSIPAVAEGRCFVADGNAYFNRPGPRIAESGEVLAGAVHPALFPEHVERYREVLVPWP